MSSYQAVRPSAQQRVIAYIDGFNLYYGLREKGWRRYYWLNLWQLVNSLLAPYQVCVCVKYFTALIRDPGVDPDKAKRQRTYIEALRTLPQVQIFYGHYLSKPMQCRNCHAQWMCQEEKKTDVNIATEMLTDAFAGACDTQLLISADSDLVPPVEKILAMFPKSRIIVAFPPARSSGDLCRLASHCFTIGRGRLSKSQFPDQVRKRDGFVLTRPAKWR